MLWKNTIAAQPCGSALRSNLTKTKRSLNNYFASLFYIIIKNFCLLITEAKYTIKNRMANICIMSPLVIQRREQIVVTGRLSLCSKVISFLSTTSKSSDSCLPKMWGSWLEMSRLHQNRVQRFLSNYWNFIFASKIHQK